MLIVPVRGGSPFSSFKESVDAAQVLFHLFVAEFIYLAYQSVQEVTVVATRIRVPSKSSNACFRISLVFMSRWLVGSSSISRFTGSSKSFNYGGGVCAFHRKHLDLLHGLFGATEHEGTQQVAYLVADFPFCHIVDGLEYGQVLIQQ